VQVHPEPFREVSQMSKIDQLEQLEKAATPKPWVDVKKSLVLHKNGRIDAYGIVRPIPEGDCLFEDGNAEFIAAARNAMPDLINEVRRLRADLQTAVDLLYAIEQDQVPGEVWQDNCYSFLDALRAREAQ